MNGADWLFPCFVCIHSNHTMAISYIHSNHTMEMMQ